VGEELSDWAVWSVVEQSAKTIGIERFGAHDLRQTTERYLGSEQEIAVAVNDNLGL